MNQALQNELLDPRELGRKLKAAHAQTRQSIQWLSQETGIGASTLYSIFNGHQLPSLDKLRRICRVLGLSLDWLLEIENDAFYIRPEVGEESRSYAVLESRWLRGGMGERLSVSRGFSIVHQSLELRRQVLERIYGLTESQIQMSLESFQLRRDIIDRYERRRVEVVVRSELEDFIAQRDPWDQLDFELIHEFISNIIERLKTDRIDLDVAIIPRQLFLVNYEILNREVIIFDLGHVFLRQNHRNVIEHFLNEIQDFQRHPLTLHDRSEVLRFLDTNLKEAASARRSALKRRKENQ